MASEGVPYDGFPYDSDHPTPRCGEEISHQGFHQTSHLQDSCQEEEEHLPVLQPFRNHEDDMDEDDEDDEDEDDEDDLQEDPDFRARKRKISSNLLIQSQNRLSQRLKKLKGGGTTSLRVIIYTALNEKSVPFTLFVRDRLCRPGWFVGLVTSVDAMSASAHRFGWNVLFPVVPSPEDEMLLASLRADYKPMVAPRSKILGDICDPTQNFVCPHHRVDQPKLIEGLKQLNRADLWIRILYRPLCHPQAKPVSLENLLTEKLRKNLPFRPSDQEILLKEWLPVRSNFPPHLELLTNAHQFSSCQPPRSPGFSIPLTPNPGDTLSSLEESVSPSFTQFVLPSRPGSSSFSRVLATDEDGIELVVQVSFPKFPPGCLVPNYDPRHLDLYHQVGFPFAMPVPSVSLTLSELRVLILRQISLPSGGWNFRFLRPLRRSSCLVNVTLPQESQIPLSDLLTLRERTEGPEDTPLHLISLCPCKSQS